MIREKTAIKYAKAIQEYCQNISCRDCPFGYHNSNFEMSCKLDRHNPDWWDIPEEEGEAEC